MNSENKQLQLIVEGALMASHKPLKIKDIQALFEEDAQPAGDEIQAAIEDIQSELRGRGFELKEVASGYRFQVIQDVAPWVGKLWEEKPQKYSRALLETLALIAYRQPITRGDIEDIRGVAVSSHIVKTLMERDWIKVVGHKDVPGRPALYATTREFLDYFNLKNLDELPTLAEIRDLDSLNAELSLEGADTTLDENGEIVIEDASDDDLSHIDSDANERQEPSPADKVTLADTVTKDPHTDNTITQNNADSELLANDNEQSQI